MSISSGVDSPTPRPAPLWRRALRWGWIAVVVVAFAVALWRQWDEVSGALAGMAPLPLAASALAGVAGVGVSGLVWRAVLTGLGAPLPVRAVVRIFFVGQLGKYLPGSVWPVLAQMELGRDHGVPGRISAAAVVWFLWVHLWTGAALACLLVPLTNHAVPVFVLLGAPLAAALLWPRLLRSAVGVAFRALRREPPERLPAGPAIAAATGWALLMWVAYGLHLWLLVVSVGYGAGTGPSVFVSAIGAFAAAWCLGFLFLVAPAGAGAREAVLLALLPLASGTALAVVIMSRLMLTAADGLWGSIGAFAARRRDAGDVTGMRRPSDDLY